MSNDLEKIRDTEADNASTLALPSLSPERVKEHLARILGSEIFRRSERLCRFLQFSVNACLSGETERTKEYVVGVEVFDRGADFDPRIDPVVRVEARRLRSKLKRWHETEGKDSELLIELPTGKYCAAIEDRRNRPATDPIVGAIKTVAVLPFTNLNGDPDLDYFSDGLTEELIHALTRLTDLHVVAWPSALHMKGQERDIAAIRDRLRVSNILRGSVRRFGDRLRMTAQLIDAASEHYLWSEAWDRSASDLLLIEQEIAAAIVQKLSVGVEHRTGGIIVPSRRDTEAHTFYLKGRFHLNKRSPEGMLTAVSLFKQAITADEHSALAWAGLADAHALIATYGITEPAQAMSSAKQAAENAIALDSSLADPLTSLAFVKGYEWKWKEAGELYRKSISLNPGYATAHHWYGTDYLVKLGFIHEAILEVDKAIALDPLSSIKLEGRAYLSMVAGDFDESRRRYEELLEHDRWFYMAWSSLGRLYTQAGEYGKAIQMYRTARAIAGDFPKIIGALGQTLALAGEREEARALLQILEAKSRTQHVGRATFALIHLGLGEFDLALQELQAAVNSHELSAAGLNIHPAWDALRSEPRFQMLLKQVGLA